MEEVKRFCCTKCHKVRKEGDFYYSNNLEKYPEGRLTICKQCLTLHIDNWDASTYLPILQECDVPYIPDQWNKLLDKYAKQGKLTGLTILGRYLATMRIKPRTEYRWADTERLQAIEDKRTEETMKRQGFSAIEIAETLASGRTPVAAKPLEEDEGIDLGEVVSPNFYGQGADEDYFEKVNPAASAVASDLDLTEEDKVYLTLKWGNMYKPTELVQLEQLYTDMMDSYDITQAGDINTLKLACKASLKSNQLMDYGDIEGAQKMSKMYNDFMKSGKWTAAQNKKSDSDMIDSVGELVAICETDKFIARYYIEQPKDKADRIIQDMQKFTRDLVDEEGNLTNLMELAFKNMQDEQERIRNAAESAEDNETAEEDALFDYDLGEDSTDEDFGAFQEFKEEEVEEDFDEPALELQYGTIKKRNLRMGR